MAQHILLHGTRFSHSQADVRERQVVNPVVQAFLYTWEERVTSEGEYLPVRVQPLELQYIDKIALLPVYVLLLLIFTSPFRASET